MQVILMRVIALDLRLKLNELVYLQLVLLLEASPALLFLEGVGGALFFSCLLVIVI